MADPEVIASMINDSELNFEKMMEEANKKQPEIVPNDLSGKVVIVTGANAGIGFETAKSIASMKPRLLILACRNVEKGEEAAKSIKSSTGFQEISVEVIDLASYASVQEFAQRFLAKGLPLDILVSNAGLSMLSNEWILTKDGHEVHAQVNHIANVLLVLLLTPALRKAAHPRIVVVASGVHFWATRPTADDLTPIATILSRPKQVFFVQYCASKLMNVLFAQEYARRCPFSVSICSANPGYTESQLGAKDEHGGNPIVQPDPPGMPPKRTAYEGAKTIIYCATSAKPLHNGGYYTEMDESIPRSTTLGEKGKEFGGRVWKETVQILHEIAKVAPFEDWIEKINKTQ